MGYKVIIRSVPETFVPPSLPRSGNLPVQKPQAQQNFLHPASNVIPVRFGTDPPESDHLVSVAQSERLRVVQRYLWQALTRLSTFWDRVITAVEGFILKAKRYITPLSVPKLREGLLPLIEQSPIGFPAAMIRAQMLQDAEKNPAKYGKELFAPYQEFRNLFRPDRVDPKQLLAQFVENEADAYLTSHILALETAIKNPDKPLKLENPQDLPTLQIGLEDVKSVLSHRTSQPLYGKDKRKISDSLYNLILASPKVALHEHYRGCAPMPLIRAKFMRDLHPKGYTQYEALQEYCRTDRLYTKDGRGPLYQPSLNRFRWKNDTLVSAAIHSPETAYLAAYLYTLKLGLENVRYFEYRLNPLSKTVKDPIHYARSIQQGIDDAKALLDEARGQKIDGNLIFSADRQPKPGVSVALDPKGPQDPRVALALQVLQSAIQARHQGVRVVGFDIQGDELNYAITDFKPVADALKAYNRRMVAQGTPELRIGATIHAGETPQSGLVSHPKNPLTGPESVAKAIELFHDKHTPVRIGHGIRAFYDLKVLSMAKRKGVGFEHCPKSNVQTGAVSYYDALPTLVYSRPKPHGFGLMISLSCDNRTTSKTNSCNELVKVTRHLGARHEDRKRLQMDGIQTAFVFNPVEKSRIISEMMETYQRLETTPAFERVIRQEQDPVSFRALVDGALN